jgi:limonene-1,2-epoxide hydrolase
MGSSVPGTISIRARLTVESRSSIEARRLEGLLRVRVAVLAAPERGAARWWCACTARPVCAAFPFCCEKEETMNHEQAQANLELVLDWIDALRRDDVDVIAERFHPDVAWEDVAGGVACEGREQVLAWLRAARTQSTDVDALELLADADHVVLGVRNHARQELAGVQLDGQLFTVFMVRGGQIVHLRDHAHRADALADAGLDYQWR